MSHISANDLKTKGIAAIEAALVESPEAIVSVRGKDKFVVTLSDGRKLTAKATETVLASLERAGVVVPALCRSGECSACRAKLISGLVFHPGSELLRKSDMRFGYIHPCVTYPISDIEILL